ncbi:hypothetical protein ACXJJ3_18310 [Kribbella sp. WER1]
MAEGVGLDDRHQLLRNTLSEVSDIFPDGGQIDDRFGQSGDPTGCRAVVGLHEVHADHCCFWQLSASSECGRMSAGTDYDPGMTDLIPVNEFARRTELSRILVRWKPPIT